MLYHIAGFLLKYGFRKLRSCSLKIIILSIFIFILHTNYIFSFSKIKPQYFSSCNLSILLYVYCSLFEFCDGFEVTLGLLCICWCFYYCFSFGKWEFDRSKYFEQLSANTRGFCFCEKEYVIVWISQLELIPMTGKKGLGTWVSSV